GSVRMVTNAQGGVVERHDYTPFGVEFSPTPSFAPRLFAGKERDAESGLDYFGARHYSDAIGRFTTVDPIYSWQENIVDPQRWNRYVYVRNNPLRLSDPDGREITYATPELKTFFGFLAERSAEVKATLALYEGPNNPDLVISQTKLPKTDDGDTAGLF